MKTILILFLAVNHLFCFDKFRFPKSYSKEKKGFIKVLSQEKYLEAGKVFSVLNPYLRDQVV